MKTCKLELAEATLLYSPLLSRVNEQRQIKKEDYYSCAKLTNHKIIK